MDIIQTFKSWYRNHKKKLYEKEARNAFQITEYDHQLWFTHGSFLIAPCRMLGCDDETEAIAILNIMRKMYIERIGA